MGNIHGGVRKRTPEQSRIVITLEYTHPRHQWKDYGPSVTDGIDCSYAIVQDYERGDLSLQDLIEGADDISVAAWK